jgi:hypothetical protein
MKKITIPNFSISAVIMAPHQINIFMLIKCPPDVLRYENHNECME